MRCVIAIVFWLSSKALRITGGAKRKKVDDEDDEDAVTTSKISPIIGEILAKEGDAKSIADAIGGSIDIEAWLIGMNTDTLEEVKDFLGKHESRGNSDYVIKGLAKFMASIIALEAQSTPQL